MSCPCTPMFKLSRSIVLATLGIDKFRLYRHAGISANLAAMIELIAADSYCIASSRHRNDNHFF